MGQVLATRVEYLDQKSEGEIHLDSRALSFRKGDFRLEISLEEVKKADASESGLHVVWEEGKEAWFEMEQEQAEKWAEKILHPPSLLDKLGVKSDSLVLVLLEEQEFIQELKKRGPSVQQEVSEDVFYDLIFYEANHLAELKKLSQLKKSLKSDGGIWVVSLKGKEAQIKDVDVMEAAKIAGLTAIKVVSFSPRHTSLKLVIPKKDRV